MHCAASARGRGGKAGAVWHGAAGGRKGGAGGVCTRRSYWVPLRPLLGLIGLYFCLCVI